MTARKAALHNLGCKVNSYEMEAMQQLLEAAGYEIVPFTQKADVYVINTCTVTNIADRKSRQMLHRAKKQNPDAVVVAAGCYAQTGENDLKNDSCVDLILGTNHKGNIVTALEEFFQASRKASEVEDIWGIREYENLKIRRTAEKARAFIKVTDGCNQFCSYCLIPYARGRVRSRSLQEVKEEAEILSAAGYQEVVLTGIHLSSYGTDLGMKEKDGGEGGLLSLIRCVNEVEGIHRIRLGSLEPGIITESFASSLAEMEKVCPHFHLSLQSGCDQTLERMNRRYRTAQYREKCSLLRRVYGSPALTTDVIVGFPGETEEEFAASKAFVDGIGFYETHIFRFSRRKGTKADTMPGQIPESVKAARSEELLQLNRKHMQEYEASLIGKKLEILVEEIQTIEGERYAVGHSKEYVPVAVPLQEGFRTGDRLAVEAAGFLQPHLLHGLYFYTK